MLIIETAPKFLPEKTYVFHVLLRQLLGVDFQIRVSDRSNYMLCLPGGGFITIEDHFFNRQSETDYLRPAGIPGTAITFAQPYERSDALTAIFGTPHFAFYKQGIQCGLDLFASAFFMLTRWEEYVRPERDEHGRFPAEQALAVRAGFIERPVVNEYAELLWQMLVRVGWTQPRPERTYRLELSYDVDYPRLWPTTTDRLRTLGGSLFRRRQPREALYWLKNHFFRAGDPYDTFDGLMDLAERTGQPAQFNFLGERDKSSDAWYALDQPFIRKLMEKIKTRGHQIGFHPSYEAHGDPAAFGRELASLRRVSGQPVLSGRHHFLRFAAPQTWQQWADAGLECDSTVGYSERPGFRAGICTPYPVFNFLTRKQLPLLEKPLIAMDVTLALYERFSPEQAALQLARLRREVRRHGGEFNLLWHNSSWNTYFWAAWQEVYRSFVSDISG